MTAVPRESLERDAVARHEQPFVTLPEDRDEFIKSVPLEFRSEGEQHWDATTERHDLESQETERQRRLGLSINAPEQQGFKVLYLSPEQIATRWGVCRRTVIRLVRAGKLRSWRIGGLVRIPRVDVEAMEAAGLQEAV